MQISLKPNHLLSITVDEDRESNNQNLIEITYQFFKLYSCWASQLEIVAWILPLMLTTRTTTYCPPELGAFLSFFLYIWVFPRIRKCFS